MREYADRFKIGSKLRCLIIDAIHNDLIANGYLYVPPSSF